LLTSKEMKTKGTKTMMLESIGHLCASLQAPYARIKRAAEALGLEPSVTINGIPHFDEEQCSAIAEHLKDRGPK
jgi:hypothetical protein